MPRAGQERESEQKKKSRKAGAAPQTVESRKKENPHENVKNRVRDTGARRENESRFVQLIPPKSCTFNKGDASRLSGLHFRRTLGPKRCGGRTPHHWAQPKGRAMWYWLVVDPNATSSRHAYRKAGLNEKRCKWGCKKPTFVSRKKGRHGIIESRGEVSRRIRAPTS